MAKSSKPVAFQVRLPAELHKRLEASAKTNGASLNSEIIDRLERTFGFFGHMTLCAGNNWSTVQLHRDELLVGVGGGSPEDIAVLKFTDNLEAFKEHFGVKK